MLHDESKYWISFIKSLPESEEHIFHDDKGFWITTEWMCGNFAGRGFVGYTYEDACCQMIDYFNNNTGKESIVGHILKRSGWPDKKSVDEFVKSETQNVEVVEEN